MRKTLVISCLLILFSGKISAQQDAAVFVPDSAVAMAYFAQFSGDRSQSPQGLFVRTALYFLDKPYVASTLEINDEEQLVVNLHEFDCTTFVETCLALSRTIQSEYSDYHTFCKELQTIRYRKGIVDGYESRLHYFSDWITDNSEKGIVEDVTHAIGGKKRFVKLNYMSTHPDLYKQLKGNPERTENIRKVEDRINSQQHYFFLPKSEIRLKQDLIKDGDIICFTTSIVGLDVTHVGIAYREKGVLSFIHASSSSKKVVVNPESLEDFCLKNKTNTGIIVLSVNGLTQRKI